ncbi:MAG: hypothetical protein ACLFQX_01900 [Candidatus Kapaibacterium sp.]
MNFAKLYILAIIAALAAGCGQVNGPTDSLVSNPDVHFETKWLCDNESGDRLNIVSRKEFDPSGRLIMQLEYDDSGVKVSQSTFEHSNSKRIEQQIIFDESGEVIKTVNFVYRLNSLGNITEKIVTNSDGKLLNKVVFDYDIKGNLSRKTEYGPTGNMDENIDYSYSYNHEGRLIERIITSNTNVNCRRDSLVYQHELNRIEKITFDASGNVDVIYAYIYNASGLIHIETMTNPQGMMLRRFEYEYVYY